MERFPILINRKTLWGSSDSPFDLGGQYLHFFPIKSLYEQCYSIWSYSRSIPNSALNLTTLVSNFLFSLTGKTEKLCEFDLLFSDFLTTNILYMLGWGKTMVSSCIFLSTMNRSTLSKPTPHPYRRSNAQLPFENVYSSLIPYCKSSGNLLNKSTLKNYTADQMDNS